MTQNPMVLIAILAAFVIVGAGWWIVTVFWHLHKSGPAARRKLVIGLQINAVLIAFAWLIRPSGLLWAALAPWYPPLALYFFSGDHLSRTIGMFAVPLMAGIGATLAVTVLCLLVTPLRLFTIGLAGFAGLATATFLALPQAETKITEVAKARGATCLAVTPLWQSRQFAGAEPQYDLHAVAKINGEWQGWSYAAADFYPLPVRVNLDEIPLIKDCAPLD